MKVFELMIGDWVKVLPISHKIEPHYDRIESIRKEYNGQIYIEGGYHSREHKGAEDWFDWSVGLNDIAPIPLTTEILKKFELSNVDDNFTLRIYFGYVYKDILDDEFLINVLVDAIRYFKTHKIKIKIRDYEENTNSF